MGDTLGFSRKEPLTLTLSPPSGAREKEVCTCWTMTNFGGRLPAFAVLRRGDSALRNRNDLPMKSGCH
ncbi:MAG TPA: hypothetical protein VGN61_04410 [Verrucomicrobiae bacterium]